MKNSIRKCDLGVLDPFKNIKTNEYLKLENFKYFVCSDALLNCSIEDLYNCSLKSMTINESTCWSIKIGK